jgi:amino acid adenylation domain-containing protein/thioester reductase-like protein
MSTQADLLTQFRTRVADAGRAPAIVSETESLGYADLDRRSDAIAAALRMRGVEPGSLVPIEATRHADFIVALLGVLKTGATYVPIDARYPDARKQYILAQCHARVALSTHPRATERPAPFISVAAWSRRCDAPEETPPEADTRGTDNPLYVIFTSGSTGVPKGVIIAQPPVASLVRWHNARFEVNAESRATLIAGLGFDISQWEIWSALTAGATLFLPDDDTRVDADALVDFFVRHRISHAFVPTALAADVVGVGQAPGLALRYLFTGGEKLGPIDTDRIRYTLVDYYGPTETTIFATCRPVPSATLGRPYSIGHPIDGAPIVILDDADQPVQGGDTGEICIGGPGVALGYLANPELSERKFRVHPHLSGQRFYHTGDRGRWLADGSLQFLGRRDDQVKIRGNLVEPDEVQATLMRTGGVRKASVLALPNAAGTGVELIAFVVPRDVAAPREQRVEALKAALRQQLPDYMWPAGYVLLDDLPSTANGKVDRDALRQRYHAQQQAWTDDARYSATELEVANAFAALVGHSRFRKTDPFFDIGGNSLLTAKLARTLSDAEGMKILLRDIYEHQSVAGLAREIESRRAASGPGLEREPTLTLQDDIRLPAQADFSGRFDAARLVRPRAILLTGATGFVGVHLLAELLATTSAVVHCLIRADSVAAGRARIDAKLRQYRVRLGAGEADRIRACPGDLTAMRFGMDERGYAALADEIDVVYHSAGAVNFIQPYSYMKKVNVDGLSEVLAFAGRGSAKALMLLSTISVYSWGHRFTGKTLMTEADDIDQNLPAVLEDIGYTRSKWVMEKMADLAARQGLPLMTFRLGYATFHSETGVSADYQWWGRLIKTCLARGTVPDLHDLREGLSTVDYMTRALAHISRKPEALGRKFNLINSPETNLTLLEFFARLDRAFDLKLRVVPFRQWLDSWKDDVDAPLYPLLSLFNDNIRNGLSTVELYQANYTWDCRNVVECLAGSGIEQPVFSREELARYLRQSIGV